MKGLKELINLVSMSTLSRFGKQYVDVEIYDLYASIRDGGSDSELVERFIEKKLNPKSALSRKKNKLKKLLTATLLFSVSKNKKSYNETYSFCYTQYAIIMRLKGLGAVRLAAQKSESLLKLTVQYQFTELNVGLSKFLMMYYSARGYIKKLKVYTNELEFYMNLYQQEAQAGIKFFKAISFFARKKKQSSFDYNQIKELLTEVAGYGMNSLELAQHVMRSKIFLASMRNDLMRLRQYYNEALDYLESLPFKAAPGSYYIFLNKLSPALILLGEYEKAAVNIDRCLSTRRPGGHNWHITLQYKAILAFYTKDYEQVGSIIQLYKKHNTPSSREVEGYWELIIAYAALMNEEDFKIGQFYNKTNSLFTDKSGAFASVLIVQYLLYLKSGNRDVLIDADENIRKYAANYLNTERNKRTYCMIRIIRELSVSKFVQSRFESKASAYIQELNDTPRKLEDLEVEIVPFEVLLGLVKNEFVAID